MATKTTKTKKTVAKPKAVKKVEAVKAKPVVLGELEAQVYNQTGSQTGTFKLNEDIFGLAWNSDLVHQVVTAMKENERQTIAHTKGRGEVRGGGKKPWRQKGTGRARHGSSRSPIWVGGGVTHGPKKDKKYGQKVNKKMKIKALFTVLSRKFRDQEVIFLDNLTFDLPKTKLAASTLNSLAKSTKAKTLNYKAGKRALVVMPEVTESAKKSFRNLGGANLVSVANLNPVEALTYKNLVMVEPEKTVALLAGRKVKKA